jgi:hypothetical protein
MKSRRLLGLRVSALAEIAVFYVVFFAAGGGETRFEEFNPHPSWFLIALLGAQYGTGEAVAAAVVSTIALRAGNLPQETLSTDLYGWMWTTLRLPLGWFLIASLTGEVRRRHEREQLAQAQRLRKAEDESAQLQSAVERMHRVKQGLETVIASQLSSAVTLYQAAKKVENLETGKVLGGSLELARAVLSCEQLSLYLVERDSLVLKLADGWPENCDLGVKFAAAHPLFRRVVIDRATLCVAREGDEHFLVRQGLMAGPLVDPETGEVLGMLKVEKMGFLAMNLSTLESFRAVCGWIAEAYAKARRHEKAAGDTMFDDRTQLYSRAFFERESAFLARLARRLRFAVVVLQIDLEAAGDVTGEGRILAAEALSRSVTEGLRTTDLAFVSGQNYESFTILLAATPLRNAPIAAAKLEKSFMDRAGDSGARLRMSWRSLYEPEESAGPSGLAELARNVGPMGAVEEAHEVR